MKHLGIRSCLQYSDIKYIFLVQGLFFKKRPRKNSTASTQSTPSTPVQQDLTPSGRKRRSDFGIPRKRRTSDSTNDGESPQKKREDERVDKSDETTDEMEVEDQNEKFRLQEQSSDLKICRYKFVYMSLGLIHHVQLLRQMLGILMYAFSYASSVM